MHCAKGAEVRLLRVDGGGHGGHVARPAQRRVSGLVKVDVLRPSHSVEMGLHGGAVHYNYPKPIMHYQRFCGIMENVPDWEKIRH